MMELFQALASNIDGLSFSITMQDKFINYFYFTLTLLAKTGSGVYRLETANL